MVDWRLEIWNELMLIVLAPSELTITDLVNCDIATKKINTMEDNNQQDKSSTALDTTPRVTGIGGIFFFTEDIEKTKKWYSENLGLATDAYGSSFEFRNAHRPEEINYLQWSPFKKGSEYFAPSKKEFMIKYRVQNIEGLIEKLKSNGVVNWMPLKLLITANLSISWIMKEIKLNFGNQLTTSLL